MPKPKSLAVIGLGSFGEALALQACADGIRVLAIDKDKRLVDRMSSELHNTMQADARDRKALRDCALDDQDMVVIAIGGDKEASLLAAEHAVGLGATHIIAKAQTDSQASILRKIGVHRIILPESDAGRDLARELTAG